MPLDQWGLSLFYPNKPGGFVYFQSDDITDDQYFNDEGHVTNSGGGQWTMTTSGPDAVQIAKNSTTANVGCSVKFSDLASRGYAYRADDPRDVELKFIVSFVDSGSDNGFAIEASTGEHSSSGCCAGYSYKLDIQYRQNPCIFRFRKEMYHVSNHTDPITGEWTSPLVNFALLGHGNVGIGFCRYNKKDGANSGHNTTDSVVLEAWFNPDPDNDPTNWTMIKRTEDKGNWGNDGDQCDGDTDQIGSWAVEKWRLKSNDTSGEFDFKHLSFREIDPTLSFEDTPEEPPVGEEPEETTLVQGLFKLQWDINTLRTSPCSGAAGGSGGSALIYSVTGTNDVEMSDNSTWQNRTIVGEYAKTSASPLVGKIIKQVDCYLKKVGTPGATPVIRCKIYNNTGALLYTSTTNLDPSTLTTSFTKQTFNCSTNTHVMVTGDRVAIEYTGTSSTNYVMTQHTNQIDAVQNTNYFSVKNGVFGGTVFIDWAADIYQ